MPPTLLFAPFSIREVKLRNRIVVPPMHQYSAVKGFPTDWHLMNAGKFAAGGAGLVVVESTKVERRGCGTVGDLGIWDDAFIAPLSRLVRFIKEQGAAAGIQIGHSGRKARARRPWEGDGALQPTPDVDDWDAWSPVAPSAIAHSAKWPVPRALERSEVKDLVEAWGQAARRAHEAGFEMLELHGAHGYLVHQFLSDEVTVGAVQLEHLEAGLMGPARRLPPGLHQVLHLAPLQRPRHRPFGAVGNRTGCDRAPRIPIIDVRCRLQRPVALPGPPGAGLAAGMADLDTGRSPLL